MKYLVVIFLFITVQCDAQLDYKNHIIIPKIGMGWGIYNDVFLAKNNGLEVQRKFILPEAYFIVQYIHGNLTAEIGFGPIQRTVYTSVGYAFYIKNKKK